MGLDTSKISLQGLGVLNANATMVSGSAPSTTFNVIVSISAVDPKWTTEGLTLSYVSWVSGESSFLISSYLIIFSFMLDNIGLNCYLVNQKEENYEL